MLASKYMGKAVGRSHGMVINTASVAGMSYVYFSAVAIKAGLFGFKWRCFIRRYEYYHHAPVSLQKMLPRNIPTPVMYVHTYICTPLYRLVAVYKGDVSEPWLVLVVGDSPFTSCCQYTLATLYRSFESHSRGRTLYNTWNPWSWHTCLTMPLYLTFALT